MVELIRAELDGAAELRSGHDREIGDDCIEARKRFFFHVSRLSYHVPVPESYVVEPVQEQIDVGERGDKRVPFLSSDRDVAVGNESRGAQ